MDTTLAGLPAEQLLDGRYRVTSTIAHGGMATVYLGVDTRLDRTVAIKIMHAELAADSDFVARFIREARSVARLSHPNVVAVFDQGSDGQNLYLAMEYVRGRTLRHLLNERGALSPREALDITESVLSGLAAAHHAGIVHRDVKPENVLLAEDGRVKVADFGLARNMTGTSNHTKTGVLMGTVAYLAPEQVTANVSDARCDVYAAGVMLFEMLTGRQPHTGESALAVAYKHVNETIPPPSSVDPRLPQALDALVTLATSRDPQLRPGDAVQFLQAVREVRGGMPIQWTPGPHSPGGPPPLAPPGGPGGPLADAPAGFGPEQAAAPFGPEQGTAFGAELATRPAAVYPPGQPYPAGPGGPGYPAQPPYQQGQHTLIVSTGDRPGHHGPREPWLQRWLFSRRLLYLVLVIILIVVCAVGAWWRLVGRYTTVPQVGHMSVTAAQAELRNMGFHVTTVAPRLDNKLPKGQVIVTVPGAGDRVRKDSTVELIPSAGPKMIGVPQVSGQPLATAQAALRQAGLTPGKVVGQVSGTIPAGIVISTSPQAGASAPQPQPVQIVVSSGPPLPNLVGQQQTAAEAWAQASGVSLNELPAPASSTQPQGTITKQSPQPNTPYTKGEVVTIYISPGPPNVAIPNVDNENLLQAVHQLQQLGFQVTTQQAGPFGRTVFNYSPTDQAPKGSTITLYYGLPSVGGG